MTISQKIQHYVWAWRTMDGIIRDYRRFSMNKDGDDTTENFCEAIRCHVEDILEYRKNHRIPLRWKE